MSGVGTLSVSKPACLRLGGGGHRVSGCGEHEGARVGVSVLVCVGRCVS